MLWIAKFPGHNDRWDVGVWELVLNRLAKSARISVPPSDSLKLSDETTFTAQRFDRTQPGGRRLFASAMTLAGKRDRDPASYVDIAEAIVQHGDPRTISDDLEQLFRRSRPYASPRIVTTTCVTTAFSARRVGGGFLQPSI